MHHGTVVFTCSYLLGQCILFRCILLLFVGCNQCLHYMVCPFHARFHVTVTLMLRYSVDTVLYIIHICLCCADCRVPLLYNTWVWPRREVNGGVAREVGPHSHCTQSTCVNLCGNSQCFTSECLPGRICALAVTCLLVNSYPLPGSFVLKLKMPAVLGNTSSAYFY